MGFGFLVGLWPLLFLKEQLWILVCIRVGIFIEFQPEVLLGTCASIIVVFLVSYVPFLHIWHTSPGGLQ